jgi:hypothetical protein
MATIKKQAAKRTAAKARETAEDNDHPVVADGKGPRVTIEQVIAAEPSANQAYMDGWTLDAPHRQTPAEVTTATPDVDTSSLDTTTPGERNADSLGLSALLAEPVLAEAEPEVVRPRPAAMPTIPQYHAQAALSALNDDARGNPSEDEENHLARRERDAAKVADAEQRAASKS